MHVAVFSGNFAKPGTLDLESQVNRNINRLRLIVNGTAGSYLKQIWELDVQVVKDIPLS